MLVKICGTTNLEDARLSVELGADALGFIFAPSKRRVTVAEVAAMTRDLPAEVRRVGVFTEPDVAAIAAAVREAGLNAVQMHWGYDREVTAAIRRELGIEVQLWQVMGFEVEPTHVGDADRKFAGLLRTSLLDAAVDAVLLDSVKRGSSGGLGQVFPWARAASILEREKMAATGRFAGTAQKLPEVILAGGLTPENVMEAAGVLRPSGVDVVSGVEASPGKKSPDRLRAFFKSAKG